MTDATNKSSASKSCDKCPAPSVLWQRTSGRHLCKTHFLVDFDRRAKHEIGQQGRLPQGRIAVALSGGKDSVAVLHFLNRMTKDMPRVDLVAVSIDEGIAGYRDGSLQICKDVTSAWNIPWHLITTKEMAGYAIDDYAAGTSGPDAIGEPRASCGACGVFRRTGINRLAREVNADVVVTGHNLDDMAQTILMNHLRGDVDRMARLAPHDDVQPGLVPRLLPFRTIPEKEVLLYGVLHGLPIHDDAECPYAARSNRFEMRDILTGIEKRHPGTRHALLNGADKMKPLFGKREATATPCATCGEPSSGETCKVCFYRAG